MEPKTTEVMPIEKNPAPTQMSVMRPAVTLAQVQDAKKYRDELIQKGLKVGKDFGVIEGTKNPTLLKPGAEQICGWFECAPEFEIVSEEHDNEKGNSYQKPIWENGKKTGKFEKAESQGLHAYRIRCRLRHRPTGIIVGEGMGSCSTMEAKYISRPNDTDNTVLKMAQKRALVAVVLTTFALSDRFTQDLEDIRDGDAHTNDEPKQPFPAFGHGRLNEQNGPDSFWGPFTTKKGTSQFGVIPGKKFTPEWLSKNGFREYQGKYYIDAMPEAEELLNRRKALGDDIA